MQVRGLWTRLGGRNNALKNAFFYPPVEWLTKVVYSHPSTRTRRGTMKGNDMITEYRNPRNVVGAGTIATALSGKRFTDAVALAVKANEGESLVEWREAKVRDWFILDPMGPINDKHGRNVRRKRWDTAYRSHCQYFGFEYGTVWLPCYICGMPFDAWTLDVEHLGGRLDNGTYPGGILLSCSGCNTTKGEGRRLPWQIRDKVADSGAARVGYSMNGAQVDHNWKLRERREDGSEQSSTPRW